ncbi:MAG: sodium ion-translocating decarboxylase subunit beta [Bacillota bacterium]|jgi:oxaloacetate decarboxylase beta subunit
MAESFLRLLNDTGFAHMDWQHLLMIGIALVLIYLAIVKQYEPLLLLPISFGMLLVNLPLAGLMDGPTTVNGQLQPGGLIYYLYQGVNLGIYPPLIFLGVGAMTDFGPLIANPRSILLGAAAQFGIFAALFGALILNNFFPGMGFDLKAAAAIGIIGGADGPTAIYLSSRLKPDLLGPIAIAAYSYMALIPIIQPPIIRMMTSKAERQIVMEQVRTVSKTEKIIFPIIVTIVGSLILPSSAALLGSLMFGNLLRESGVVNRLFKTAENELINIITIFLGLSVGAKAKAELFLQPSTLGIITLGLIAFCFSTAGGMLLGKIMCKLSGGKINPMIGAAGVSAVPMAARVVQKVGAEERPGNYLLMHAMGPNVAGVIGSAIAAGVLLAWLK